MNNVAIEVESDPTYRDVIEASRGGPKQSVADGIVSAAREIAETADIKVICCYSEIGQQPRPLWRANARTCRSSR